MSKPGHIGERLVALFILGACLFGPPFLSIFNRAEQPLGIPLLYLYLFLAWALLIALTALLVERAEAGGERLTPWQGQGQQGEAPGADD
jgi:hypothetical protein